METRREFDFRVGGRERLTGVWPGGRSSDFDAIYWDVVPDQRIVFAYGMHVDRKRISVSLVTVEFKPAGDRTELTLTEQDAFLDGSRTAAGASRARVRISTGWRRRCVSSPARPSHFTSAWSCNMPTVSPRAEAEIRALIDERVLAIRAKDVASTTASLASDVLLFGGVNPLQYSGSDAVRRRLVVWFSSFQGPISHEIRDLSVAASDDVAFSHGLNRVTGTKSDGGELDMWWRATVCYRKVDGRWMITHEHASVPFEGESGQASLALKP